VVINCSLSLKRREFQHHGRECSAVERTILYPESGAPVGGKAWPPLIFYCHRPWQWNIALARVLAALAAQKRAPASNSNSGACYASVLSRPAALPDVPVLSESEVAKVQQVLSDADACADAVITTW